jgi:hypothetical protein
LTDTINQYLAKQPVLIEQSDHCLKMFKILFGVIEIAESEAACALKKLLVFTTTS